jgi:hypothetical protein
VSHSEEQPSYILDTSFVRSASSDGHQIRAAVDVRRLEDLHFHSEPVSVGLSKLLTMAV